MASSSTRHRLLTVHVRSADIYKKSNGPYYVKLSYSPEEKLQTRSVSQDILFRATWNQGFVFAVPSTALFDGKSSIKFEIFQKNEFLKDSLLGKVEVKLDSLKVENKVNDDVDDGKDEVKYDTANEHSGSEDEEERDGEERKTKKRDEFPEIKEKVSVKIKKAKLEVEIVVSKGTLNKVGKGCYWRGFAMEQDEFLGNKQICLKAKKKKNSFFLMCVKN